MIIIDSQSEIRLTQTLEAVKDKPGTKRCLWINLSSLSDLSPNIVKTIITDISRFITSDECQLFQLFTNDLVIVGNALTREQQRTVHKSVSNTLNLNLSEEIVELYELGVHWGHVAVMTEKSLQNKREAALAKKQQAAIKERQEILNMEFDPATINKMKSVRNNRKSIEIMVVEDDAFSRKMVFNSLSKYYKVNTAVDGKNALTTYVSKAPDVLFLDIELPDITGHDVLKKITAMDSEAYIVMLSGNGDKENIMKAMQAGAKGFVAKPFSKEKLFQYIERSPAHQKQPA